MNAPQKWHLNLDDKRKIKFDLLLFSSSVPNAISGWLQMNE